MTWRFFLVFSTLSILAMQLAGCGEDDALPPDYATPQASSAKVDRFQLAWENFSRITRHQPDDVLEETVERLNQWSLNEPFEVTWEVDPLVETLPPPLLASSRLPIVKRLGSSSFFKSDGPFLHEALLMRDASAAIIGDESDPLEQVKLLFDWTLRNIQLDPSAMRLWPRENLLLGRAAPLDREWVFLMLARQQQLDVVWLAVPQDTAKTRFRLWCPAFFHEGELYPFDLLWGSPVMMGDGSSVASLSAAADDDALLRALDVSGKPYPIEAADLESVVALIAAREPFLSRRMLALQQRVPAKDQPVLSVSPSRLAGQIAAAEHVVAVRLWSWPYEYAETFRNGVPPREDVQLDVNRRLVSFYIPHVVRVEDRVLRSDTGRDGDLVQQGYETTVWPLWAGRLHHLTGRFESAADADARLERKSSAIPFYLVARSMLGELKDEVAAQQAAGQRLTDDQLKRQKQVLAAYARLNRDASYWLGLIRFEQGDYATAANFFKRTLEIAERGPQAAAVRYNLGRAYEAMQQDGKAIEQYRQERSPASLLRIRQLKAHTQPSQKSKS